MRSSSGGGGSGGRSGMRLYQELMLAVDCWP